MDEGKQADGGYDPSAPPQKNAEAQDGDDTILVNASKQQGKDSKAKHQDGQVSSSKKRKRGMKPRSKRNRKRPRGGVGVHNLNGDGGEEGGERHTVEVEIKPLVFPKESSDEDVGRQTNEKETANNGQRRIRVIKPYPFTFATFAKARWVGRSIIDVYFKEFGSYPKSYYESAIGEGRILVSGTKVTCEYKVKGGDELSHVVHRHEPAVSICEGDVATGDSEMIKVVHNDENIIVVDKPSTLPVHPCGGYNFNSLFHILATQDPSLEGKLFTVHRLDRLTSGLTIVAKSTQVAQVLGKCISDRENCNKIYVARVKGQFPKLAPQTDKLRFEGDVDANVAPFLNGERNMDGLNLNEKCSKGYWITDEENSIVNSATLDEVFESRLEVTNLGENGNITGQTVSWLHLACPCEITCHKNGICKAGSGKAAQTAFAVIGYDPKSDSTVVLAKPSTGRTHQIRLHLQYLGHPIANDPNYGGDMFFGDTEGSSMCQLAKKKMESLDEGSGSINGQPENAISTDVPATEAEVLNAGMHLREKDESLLHFIKRSCVWCARSKGKDRDVLEFLVRSQGIWLHAYQYQMLGPDGKVCFKTNLPRWSSLV